VVKAIKSCFVLASISSILFISNFAFFIIFLASSSGISPNLFQAFTTAFFYNPRPKLGEFSLGEGSHLGISTQLCQKALQFWALWIRGLEKTFWREICENFKKYFNPKIGFKTG